LLVNLFSQPKPQGIIDMETKEINVSEIQTQAVESNAVAVAAPTTSEATQAALISESIKAALETLGITKQKDPFVEAAKQDQANAEIEISKRPPAEVFKGRAGKINVYIPYDIRQDLESYGDVIRDVRYQLHINEFNYLGNEGPFNMARAQVLISGLQIFRCKENIRGYLDEVGYMHDDDQEFVNRIRTELGRILVEVDEFYASTLGNLENLKSEDVFSYDELSVLLSQVGIQFALKDGSTSLGISTYAATQRQSMGGPYLEAIGFMYARNGSDIQRFQHTYYFGGFEGKKSLNELGLTPIKNNEELKQSLIARGKKAVEVTAKSSYMAYKGDLIRRGYWSDTAFRSTGRVMVDFAAMRVMDPNYNKYVGGTQDKQGYGYKPKEESVNIDDSVYLQFSPYVYGFSFLSKVWGEMLVENISEIAYRSDAYDKLVMEEAQKNMILSLVATQLEKSTRPDIIDGKGGGCIFLLAGEPGTGKTLTAEVTAEYLKRPLYMVGVGELGTSAQELEGNLREILDVASTWNAVLLLDECDIFMEARTDSNIQRNAMVGVFLRLLEYYQGVLFLTSNRAKNIDKAFYSRISMAINFPGLEASDRYKIWENNLNLNDVVLTEDEIWDLSRYEVNGRQIKNVCRNAHALALRDGRTAQYSDFTLVLEKGEAFQEAVFQLGTSNTDMSFNAIAAHHEEEFEFIEPARYSSDDGFWTRLGRAVKAFFA